MRMSKTKRFHTSKAASATSAVASDRMLLLYLRTGGGHMAAAKAIRQGLHERFSGIEAIPFDGVRTGSIFQRAVLESGYRVIGIRHPIFWPGLYEVSKIRAIQDIYVFLMGLYSTGHLIRAIRKHRINRVIVFHYLLTRPLKQAIRRIGKDIPVTVVVTDPFTAHPMWFTKHSYETIVFSRGVRDIALKCGHSPKKVEVFPPILNRRFDIKVESTATLKEKHKISGTSPVVLVAAGGDGLPNGRRIVAALCKADLGAHILVVCGRDVSLYRAVRRVVERVRPENVKVFGFVDYMYELMSCADVVVAKAGPAVVMESILLEKPLVVSSYLYGQERGNLELVTSNRLGFYRTSPKDIADTVSALLKDDDLRSEIAGNIRKVGLKNGTDEIIDRLVSRDR